MATLTRSITIEAPIETVFDRALDIRTLWSLPDVGLANVELTPDGVGSSAQIYEHMLGFHIEMGLEYIEVVRPNKIVAKIDGFGPDNPTWTFTFEPADEGTKMTAEGEWHINVPAVGRPMEGMMVKEHKDVVTTMLTNVKAEAELATV